MSKLIVEMEMPTVCDECPMMYDGIVCAATGTAVYPNHKARILKNGREFDPCENRLDDCPICGELPDEHGDLIDRDELKNNLWSEHAYYYNRTDAAIAVQACIADVEISKAVIKAERKDDDKQRSNIYS